MSNAPKKIVVDGIEYAPVQNMAKADGMEYVIVRTYSAGVHAGFLEKQDGKMVVLRNTRRIWYWKGAASLSQMALSGVTCPNECKFSVTIQQNTLTEAIEIMLCTKEAMENIMVFPECKN